MPLTEKDRILINELLAGTQGAWNSFVDRFANLIVQVIQHTAHAHSVKLNRDDVDDLTADVFTALLDRDMGAIRGFRGRCSFSTYLTVVARRIALRKMTQRRYLEAFGHVQAHQASVMEAAEHHPNRRAEHRDEVDSLMRRLPEALQNLLRMFYLEERTYADISERLGIPRNSIGPTLARAKTMLRAKSQ